MSDKVQAELVKQFFPNTREEWRKHDPPADRPKMTRQEQIDNAVVGLDSTYMLPINKWQYEGLYGHLIGEHVSPYHVYGDYITATFTKMPTWEELVASQKPWLRSDEEFAKWQTLEPFDRFRLMVCGLPWDDEVIDLLKSDDGPRTQEEGSDGQLI
jgi:hypothetical protein